MLIKRLLSYVTIFSFFVILSCTSEPEFYSVHDFQEVQKIDVHFHYNVDDTRFLEYADSLNFMICSPNTRTIEDEQFDVARSIKNQYPEKFAFFGTFSLENWDQPEFINETIERIELVLKEGAIGIKIWKNIGMVIQDSTGNYLMVDDPLLKPVFDYLEKNNIPVLGHLGEPKNCWLPLDEMTVKSNRDYYTQNPKYHMYRFPEAPSYDEHIEARDNILERHPDLNFIGAHLASLEWDVEEIAKRLDQFPNLTVDMASRVNHLQYQSLTDWNKVRNFLIEYQDRVLYATDRGFRPGNTDLQILKQKVLDRWMTEWVFLATDSVFQSPQLDNDLVTGLQLPKEVIDKIYFTNAVYLFN